MTLYTHHLFFFKTPALLMIVNVIKRGVFEIIAKTATKDQNPITICSLTSYSFRKKEITIPDYKNFQKIKYKIEIENKKILMEINSNKLSVDVLKLQKQLDLNKKELKYINKIIEKNHLAIVTKFNHEQIEYVQLSLATSKDETIIDTPFKKDLILQNYKAPDPLKFVNPLIIAKESDFLKIFKMHDFKLYNKNDPDHDSAIKSLLETWTGSIKEPYYANLIIEDGRQTLNVEKLNLYPGDNVSIKNTLESISKNNAILIEDVLNNESVIFSKLNKNMETGKTLITELDLSD